MFYTYMHVKADTGQPFYIGKGKGKRAWAKHGRNIHWHRTAAKHGVHVEILSRWELEADALEHERLLIACMKERLVNLSDGGEGSSGYQHLSDAKQKMSAAFMARSDRQEVQVAATQAARLSNIGRPKSIDTKRKLSERFKRRDMHAEIARKQASRLAMQSTEVRTRISQAKAGKPLTLKNKRALRDARGTKVVCIETGTVFPSFSDARDWLLSIGFAKARASNIQSICNGKRKSAHGYTWKFLGEVNV